MKRARVLRRSPRLFIHAVSKTPVSSWVIALPVVVAELAESDTFLGEAVADALACSRSGARDADDVVRKQILEKARKTKWSTFVRGTSVCDVEMDAHGIRFFPSRAARRSLVPTDAPRLELESSAPAAELGAALKRALRSIEPRRARVPPSPRRRDDSPSPEPPPEAPSAHRLQRNHSPERRRRQERP